MTLFALVQNCHGGFEFRGVPAEGLFHNPRSFRSQLQHLGAPITRRCSANDESLFLQSIDRSSHRAEGQRHLALDFRNRQRTLMQKGFERRKIREAQSCLLDAPFRNVIERAMAPRKNQPQSRRFHLGLAAHERTRSGCRAGEAVMIARSAENAPAPRIIGRDYLQLARLIPGATPSLVGAT